jgi:hypothetical protein
MNTAKVTLARAADPGAVINVPLRRDQAGALTTKPNTSGLRNREKKATCLYQR